VNEQRSRTRDQKRARLEDEAVRRAHDGVTKPVLYQGKRVYINGRPLYEHEYSDAMLMFLLKPGDRERFGDKSQLDLKWSGRLEDLSDEQLDQLIEQFAALAEAQQKQKQLEAAAPAAEQTVDVKP
jgi:hypothetical protein